MEECYRVLEEFVLQFFWSQFLILRSAGEPEPRIRGALGFQRFLPWERK